MLRTILGIVAGAVVAILTVMGLEMIGHAAMPPPAGLDPADPEDLKQMVAAASTAAKAWVVFAWFGAVVTGGWVARRLSRKAWAGWVIAGLILLGGVANLVMIPHPLWMQIGAIAAPLLGGWIVTRLPVGGSAAVS
ncbi:hypothetical protein [uncultured Brevundimonas sp.]|uniref:hypothetical protein n=1 Tax=uncultured Brevundimonas sp. TaxID=213418 RepID=UPI002617DD22|nr:hypothetical protein [uncultured Brevundimonas sp.]